jgi:hypothetical protein
MEKLQAKVGTRKVDPSERSIFDLFEVGNGFGTPENGPYLSFYTASIQTGPSIAQKWTPMNADSAKTAYKKIHKRSHFS